MKPTRNAPATHLQPVTRPNGTHAFQRLAHDRQRDELAKGIADFEQRMAATTDWLRKLEKRT